MELAIIDYGMGNLRSVDKALRKLGFSSRIVERGRDLGQEDALVLPGVGAFGAAMRNIRERGFEEPLREWFDADRPFLGICLGLQLMYEASEESPGVRGLGVFPGTIRRFPPGMKVPQIGWNLVRPTGDDPVFLGRPDYFYFVHSYYAPVSEFTLGISDYGIEFSAALARGNLWAFQFHPEKSSSAGLGLLERFGGLVDASNSGN